jgi:phosphopantothenoylcysteine synthetase/decarboxylase
MHRAVLRRFPRCDALLMTAAVGDFRPRARVSGKIKKDEKRARVLHLVRNPDILAECGRLKKRGQILVGFALESMKIPAQAASKGEKNDLRFTKRGVGYAAESGGAAAQCVKRAPILQPALVFARGKLARKNLDLIVLNSPATFRAKGISGLLFAASGRLRVFRNHPKARLVTQLVALVEQLHAVCNLS